MTKPRYRIFFSKGFLIVTLFLADLSGSLIDPTNASEAPEDYLKKMRDLPFPNEKLNDRGLLIDEIEGYISTYLKIATEFHTRFPEHPEHHNLIEEEIDMVFTLKQIISNATCEGHISFLTNLYPSEMMGSAKYLAWQMTVIKSDLSNAETAPLEEKAKLRKTALEWAASHRTVSGANDIAYRAAIQMARDDSPADRSYWFQAFQKAFPEDPRGAAMPTTEATVEIGEPLNLMFKDVEGKAIDTAQYIGKTVVIDFWATWCGPCLEASEKLKKLYEKYGEKYGLQIIGVSTDKSLDDLTKFLEKKSYSWPIVWDGAQDESGRWSAFAIPYYLIIDPQGNLRHRGNLSGSLQEVLDVLGVREGLETTMEITEEDFEPLVAANANVDELVETLLTGGDKPPIDSREILKSYDGDQSRTRSRVNQLRGAHVALMNDLAWRFLQDYPDHPRTELALKVWASSICSRYLVDAPELVKAKMVRGGPDARIQITKMSEFLGPEPRREIDLVKLVYDVRGLAKHSISDATRFHWMQKVDDFCEAAPDDPLNAPAFFETMSVLNKKGEDPAQVCHAPLRLRARDINGATIDTKDWRGKVVLVYFGYYPQTNTPYLRQLWRELRGPDFEMVEINQDWDILRIREYRKIGKMYSIKESKIEESPIPWPVVSVDKRSPLSWLLNWQYGGNPSFCVLDREGRICQTGIGWGYHGITVGNKNYRVAIDRAPIIHELVKR